MLDPKQLKRDILDGLRVELTDEFDRNFERKAFFSDKWKPMISLIASIILYLSSLILMP